MKNKKRILSFLILFVFLFAGCKQPVNETPIISEPEESIEYSIEESSVISEPSEEPEPPPPPEPKKATEDDLKKIKDYDSKYFVKKLSDENKYHFVELYTGIENFSETIEFYTPVTENDLTTLMYLLNYDCPELIQLNGDYYPQYSPSNEITAVGVSYCMPQETYEDAQKELDHFYDILKEKIQGKEPYDIEKTVYDLIFSDCLYYENDPITGSVYGTLIEKTGRCEGFSKSFAWCMRKLGFECLTVLGAQEWEPDSMFANHSWNILKINDQYYHVDLAVDNLIYEPSSAPNPANYGFLNVPDELIMHQRNINEVFSNLGVPSCTSTELNYHIMNGLFIKKGEPVKERINEILESHFTDEGISDLSIKFEDKDDYEQAVTFVNNLTRTFLDSHSDKPINFLAYYNVLSRTLIIDTYT